LRPSSIRPYFHTKEHDNAGKENHSWVREAKREGKSLSTQAGEFVREEMEHIRQGKHGARSAKQALAIGLSKARRAGVKLPPPAKGEASEKTRKSAERAFRKGQGESPKGRPSAKRSKAITRALKDEGTSAASHEALSRQTKSAAKGRTANERSAAAKKAARTKGPAGRSAQGRPHSRLKKQRRCLKDPLSTIIFCK